MNWFRIQSTYSSHDTAKAAHVADDHIAKAVIVRDEQGYAMVVIPASHWLKLEALQAGGGSRFCSGGGV